MPDRGNGQDPGVIGSRCRVRTSIHRNVPLATRAKLSLPPDIAPGADRTSESAPALIGANGMDVRKCVSQRPSQNARASAIATRLAIDTETAGRKDLARAVPDGVFALGDVVLPAIISRPAGVRA
ncbi:MAG: hypothetical protein Kow0013_25930 [Pararhodobacter sp.]